MGECGCKVDAKLKSRGDWFNQSKNLTKEAFVVDFGHVTFSDLYPKLATLKS